MFYQAIVKIGNFQVPLEQTDNPKATLEFYKAQGLDVDKIQFITMRENGDN